MLLIFQLYMIIIVVQISATAHSQQLRDHEHFNRLHDNGYVGPAPHKVTELVTGLNNRIIMLIHSRGSTWPP